jgi:hypothetical protein
MGNFSIRWRVKTAMPEANAQLDYAPAPPVLRRRRVRRVILGIVLLGAVVAGWRWGPGAYRRASLLYWQRQCLRYAAPGERVIYESDPGAGAALRAADRHYQLVTPRWVSKLVTSATGHVPDCWTRFGGAGPGFPTATGPVLFLHELRTPSGQRRLVAITAAFPPNELPKFISGYDVEAQIIEPGTWKLAPQNQTGGIPLSVLSGIPPTPPHVRVLAGQPDPADPSHFTVRFEVDGVAHVADGWLRDGSPAGFNLVEFKVRG